HDREAPLHRGRRRRPACASANQRDAAALLSVLPVEPTGSVPGLRATRRLRARAAPGCRGRRRADPAQPRLRRGRADGAPGGRSGAEALVMLLASRGSRESFRSPRVTIGLGDATYTQNGTFVCAAPCLSRMSLHGEASDAGPRYLRDCDSRTTTREG